MENPGNLTEEELLAELLKEDLEDDIVVSSDNDSEYDDDDLMKFYAEESEIPQYACEYCGIH